MKQRPHLVAALVVIGVTTLLRLIWAGLVELAPDEAYYWTWSRDLAWGYYDHPPLLAWLIRASTTLLGDHEIAVRLPAVLLGAATSWVAFLAARDLWNGDRWGLVAVIVINATVLFSAGASLAGPDAPLIFCWLVALYLGARGLDSGQLRHWLPAGLAAGLALQSKYTAALLPLCALLYLVSSPARMQHLRRQGPYLAAAVALAVFLPNLLWNSAHEYASLGFQVVHAVRGPGRGAIANLGEFIGGQALLVNPVFFIGCLATLSLAGTRERESQVLLRFFFLVPLLVFAAAACARKIEANWPAVAWPAGFLALAGRYRERLTDRGSAVARRWRKAAWLGVAMGVTMAATAHLHAACPFLATPARQDPTARLRGWEALAGDVARERARMGPELPLYTRRYQEAAELTFYDRVHPPPRAFGPGWRCSQYDLTPDPVPRSMPALVLWEDGLDVPPELAGAGRLRQVGAVQRRDRGNLLTSYILYFRPGAAGAAPSP